jgi:hypothetical protein
MMALEMQKRRLEMQMRRLGMQMGCAERRQTDRQTDGQAKEI